MPNKFKLVALDMDGTTYFGMGDVVPENIDPIIKTQEKGVRVVFVTGRPINASKNNFEGNGFTKHEAIAIGYNGALIYDFAEKKAIEKNPISKETVTFAFLESYKYNDDENVIWAYPVDEDKVYLNKDINGTPLEPEKNFFAGSIKTLNKESVNELMDCYKILVTNCTDDFLEKLSDNGFEVAYSKASIVAEVNKKSINKKHGVKFLCDKYSIKPEEVIAIGDGKNDVPMLEYAGLSLAPLNANEAVKSIVNEVLPLSNVEGAVAYALKKYILEEGE